MKRGLVGSLIGVIMLSAVCAGHAWADGNPLPAKVNVKPRMASPAKSKATDRTPADIPADDNQAADIPAKNNDARPDTPALQFAPVESFDPQGPSARNQTPYSYAAWELPGDDPEIQGADLFPEVPDPEPLIETDYAPAISGWDTDVAQLRERITELEADRELRQLTDRVREVEAAACGVDVTDEPWQLEWGGRIHADMVYWPDDTEFGGRPNYVEFRRLRMFCSGEGYGVWNYKLEFDLAPEVQGDATVSNNRVNLDNFGLEVKDAYLGIRDIPVLGYVRAGHFKVPFGLEELTSSNYITFLERNSPHRFAPGREFGIAAHRYFPAANMTCAYGAFYDEMSETAHAIVNDNQGYRAGMRVTWAPWYDECTGGRNVLHTGLAYLYTLDADREVRFTSRAEIHRGSPLVDTGRLVANQIQQVDTELAWVHGPLSAQGEFVYTQVNDAAAGTTNLWGAYAFASYFLTGEHRPYDREEGVFGRVEPFENFWYVNTPSGCATGWGAWELALRYSYLDFRDIGQQQLHDLTLGLNWYWNPNARLMFNWIHPLRLDDMSGLAQGDVIGLRFQIDF